MYTIRQVCITIPPDREHNATHYISQKSEKRYSSAPIYTYRPLQSMLHLRIYLLMRCCMNLVVVLPLWHLGLFLLWSFVLVDHFTLPWVGNNFTQLGSSNSFWYHVVFPLGFIFVLYREVPGYATHDIYRQTTAGGIRATHGFQSLVSAGITESKVILLQVCRR